MRQSNPKPSVFLEIHQVLQRLSDFLHGRPVVLFFLSQIWCGLTLCTTGFTSLNALLFHLSSAVLITFRKASDQRTPGTTEKKLLTLSINPLLIFWAIGSLLQIGLLNNDLGLTPIKKIHCKSWQKQLPTSPGQFDPSQFLFSKAQVCEESQASNPKQKPIKNISIENVSRLTTLQNEIQKKILSSMQTQAAGTFEAMFLGNKKNLNPEVSKGFRKTGLYHILAISGFHVALLALFLLLFLSILPIPKQIQLFLTMCLLLLYIPLAGGTASLQRASIVFALFALVKLYRQISCPINSLSLAGTLILIVNPYLIINTGFQLSFLATFFILYLHPWFKKKLPMYWPKTLRVFLETIGISLWASIGTIPILLSQFHAWSPISIPLGLVLIPIMSLFYLSSVLGLAFAWLSPWIADCFFSSSQALFWLTQNCVDYISKQNFSQLYFTGFSSFQTVVFYFCGLCIPSFSKGGNKFLKRSFYTILLVFALQYFQYSIETHFSKKIVISFLDVGQGDATLIQIPGNINILVDAGNSSPFYDAGQKVIGPYLKSLGIQHINALIITHADQDHFAGSSSLFQDFLINRVYTNSYDLNRPKKNWLRWKNNLQQHNIPISILKENDQFDFGKDIKLKILGPAITTDSKVSSNSSSVVLILSIGNQSILLTGDLEKKGEINLLKKHPNLKVQILKAGHHGSKTSSDSDFIKKISPEFILVSAGYNQRFEHPSPSIIQQFEQKSIPYFNSAWSGSVRFTITHESTQCEAYQTQWIPCKMHSSHLK